VRVHAASEELASRALPRLEAAWRLAEDPVASEPHVRWRIDRDGTGDPERGAGRLSRQGRGNDEK
jgi:hypothetical protein